MILGGRFAHGGYDNGIVMLHSTNHTTWYRVVYTREPVDASTGTATSYQFEFGFGYRLYSDVDMGDIQLEIRSGNRVSKRQFY